METLEGELVESSDRTIERRSIHFEPGIHTFLNPHARSVVRGFNSGDLTAHFWIKGRQIANRMREYNPEIVAIDGLTPWLSELSGEEKAKRSVWLWLPGSPSEITSRGSLNVVLGDPLFSGILPDNGEVDELVKKVINEFINLENNALKDYLVKLSKEEAATFAASAVLISAALVGSRLMRNKDVVKPRRGMSRRKFLGLMAGASMVSLARLISPIAASFSPQGSVKDFFETVLQPIKYRFSYSNWLDGRTAVLIAKTKEAMDLLEMPKDAQATVLMGFPHGWEAEEFLNNELKRQKAIREYAEDMLDALYEADEKLGGRSLTEEQRRSDHQFLSDYLSNADVFKVEDPGIQKTSNPMELIGRVVEHTANFDCREVKEAASEVEIN